ncbi:MAG: DUF2855 family protein [Burkholderiaceae bacterium]
MTQTRSDFLVRRDDLHATAVRDTPLPGMLDEGDVLMTVDRFALTANNVTYAAFGDAMSYWDFFPVTEDGWGRVPVWGFGTVVDSRCDGIVRGERFYGYFPMSSDLLVRPVRVRESGFVDGSAHRQKLHPLYNQYTRNATDPLYDAAREELQMLLRPLFITSFVIDDFLADSDFFGAHAVILSSASSKTAYGLAWQLSLRRPDGPEVIALTSPGNVAFVAGLGCYDRVVTYEAIASLPPDLPVIYVDFAGDRVLRANLHRHFGDAMRHSSAVGSSHWDAERESGDGEALPGAKPTFFFAPAQIKKRSAEWGADGFGQRFAAAWHAFVARVVDPARPWMTIFDERGADAVERVYRELLDGRARPQDGRILSMRG